ncbi:hypothetical protein [Plantactinospora soyae]|uniref:Uncharacterized protein n=1 Tax=Plantactinospora soyae TaxID=1544732 RepID=A0A927R165_9ACTN|nr:hypothetical protein [Plantactinospora soyae]MBE1491012.1 hypothetical protein [Plantactinospora soyae]
MFPLLVAVVTGGGSPSRWPDEQLVAALVPRPLPAAPPPTAPVPTLPTPPPLDGADATLFDVARPDAAGRVTARGLVRALRWPPGHRLRVDVTDSTVLITSAPDGIHMVGTREELPLPAAARHLTGITPGETVLLVALPAHDLLLVHPSNTITRLLTGSGGLWIERLRRTFGGDWTWSMSLRSCVQDR